MLLFPHNLGDMTMDKLIRNTKINRITFLVAGILFMLMGLAAPVLLVVGGLLIFLAYKTDKRYKELLNEANKPKPEPVQLPEPVVEVEPVVKVDTDKVKITELNGNVIEVSTGLMLDDDTLILTTPNSKKYHTHVGCFKNWRPEMRATFTGWTIMKKEDAIKNGMTYCKFCDENDDLTLDDIEDIVDDEDDI